MRHTVLSTASRESRELALALSEKQLLVVGLCAAWCNTCGEFRKSFEELAEQTADAVFVWLDIEDDADLAGDIDVENFPTLAVFCDDRLVHFGVSLPQKQIVSRLIASLGRWSETVIAEEAIARLRGRLTSRNTS